MSEERMERRVARCAPDSRKPADGTQKPWPRSSKKRELPSATTKNDFSRKNVPAPRGRWQGDRRPRPRAPQEGALGGAEMSGLAEQTAELGSVFVPGPKKQNLSHLLNFVYSPRGPPVGSPRGPAATARRPHAPQRTSHPHDRDLFLQASCQFAVKSGGDYRAHLVDPDLPVKWDQVEQIVVRVPGSLDCPVCLAAPVAARITRCGHVYCWACALHYVAVHERSPPPCPVCAAPLHVGQLKSARVQHFKPSNDEEVCMRLVRRARGSTVVEVAPERGGHRGATLARDVTAWNELEDQPYDKLFTITSDQVRNIIQKERSELSNQILDEIDTTEIVYLEQALDLLKVKEEELNMQPKFYTELEKDNNKEPPTIIEINCKPPQNKLDWFDLSENEMPTSQDILSEEVEALNIEEEGACALNPDAKPFVLGQDGARLQDVGCSNAEVAEEFPLIECSESEDKDLNEDHILTDADRDNQAKYFYFYQAEDGQHVFLHGVDVRLLCASWGALAAAPARLRGRLLRRESFSLTEQSRKHMPCASHLPLYCPYDVVELELRPPYVTHAALRALKEELERRTRARTRLEREEKRRERAALRSLEGFCQPRPDFSSEAQFPSYSPPSPPLQPAPYSSPTPQPLPPSPSGLSFAKMAGAGGTWRVRESRPATPPPGPAGDDDEAPAVPRTLSLSDAIEAALYAGPAPSPASKGGARKKNKHKLLFSTGVQRAA